MRERRDISGFVMFVRAGIMLVGMSEWVWAFPVLYR